MRAVWLRRFTCLYSYRIEVRSMSPLTAQPPAKNAEQAQVEDTEETKRQDRSAIKAAFIGTFIEWFDYAAYIYMSAIISRVFFPEMEGRRALIMTFALFALSFRCGRWEALYGVTLAINTGASTR